MNINQTTLLSNYDISIGIINVLLKHISALLFINKNADPCVLTNMENFLLT